MKIERNKLLSWASISVIGFAIIFAGWAIFIFARFYDLADNKLDLDSTSKIGDFIGGILGPLLSFAGVLLFYLTLRYQKEELALQREELKATRNEFHLNRHTTILYNQIQRIEPYINEFKFSESVGREAIVKLGNLIKYIPDPSHTETEMFRKRNLKHIEETILSIQHYNSAFINLIGPIKDSTDAFKTNLEASNLSDEEKFHLKRLFFLNLGSDVLNLNLNLQRLYDQFYFYNTRALLLMPNVIAFEYLVNLSKQIWNQDELKILQFSI